MTTRRGRGRPGSALLVVLLAVAALLYPVLVGCGGRPGARHEGVGMKAITDLAGRRVELPVPASRVAAIGPGALRLVCYTGGEGAVVGIENIEKQYSTGRPYIMASPELLDLPVIGQGGPDSTPDSEMLVSVAPDVIFAAYLVDASKADELQAKTGIPVVMLSYGQLGTYEEEVFRSLELIGEVTGHAGRAREVVEYLKDCQADLRRRTADITSGARPSVYVGGLSMKGTHGIESSQANFPPLVSVNALNVLEETGAKGSVMIDKEKILEWDPDIIFLDESALEAILEDYSRNPGFYEALSAVREGKLYGYLPFNFYTTNIDTAVADSYFMGKILYPDRFKDVDPVDKADAIYEFLLGAHMYERMAADFGGFRKIDPAAESGR